MYSYKLVFEIFCIIYGIVLLIEFILNKKNNKTKNIYFSLVINSIVLVILNMMNDKLLINFTGSNLTTIIVSKLSIASMVSWVLLFVLYIVVSAFENNVKDITKVIKRTRNNLGIMYIIYLFILIFVPVNYIGQQSIHMDSKIIDISYLFSAILILMSLVALTINKNNIRKKIIIPFASFIILSIFYVLAYNKILDLSLFIILPVFINSLIYFEISSGNKVNTNKKYNDIEFISNASCEMNSSLNDIVNYSNDVLKDNLNDNSKEDINNIIATSEDLMQLSNSIADVLKIENDKFELNNQEYNLKEIFDDVVQLVDNRIYKKDIDFKYEYDNNIPPVLYGDCKRIKQVMLNILINSIKYTYSGYIKYSILFLHLLS